MSALQWNLGDQHNLSLATVIAEQDAAIVGKRALLYFPRPAEPKDLRPGARCELNAGQIIRVEHSKILRLLIFENARLGVGISGESAMPVEMVGCDIEHYGNLWTECLDGFKLKA